MSKNKKIKILHFFQSSLYLSIGVLVPASIIACNLNQNPEEDKEDDLIASFQSEYTTVLIDKTVEDLNLKIGQEVSVEDLGISFLVDAKFTIIIKELDVLDGEIIVDIKLEKNTKIENKNDITIKGFKKLSYVNIIDNYLHNLSKEWKTSNTEITIEELELTKIDQKVSQKMLGIELPLISKGFEINLILKEITKPSHHENIIGKVAVEVIISYQDYSKSQKITVSEFNDSERILANYIKTLNDVGWKTTKQNLTTEDINTLFNAKQANEETLTLEELGIILPPMFHGISIEDIFLKIHIPGEGKIFIVIYFERVSKKYDGFDVSVNDEITLEIEGFKKIIVDDY